MKEIHSKVDTKKTYTLEEAVSVLKENSNVKFDETVELTVNTGADPRKSDQMIRSVVSLPHGTGKKVRIMVFASEAQEKDALDAGADYAGYKEYLDKVKAGWLDFDVLIATPEMMKEVGKLGKILGPKGLMPSPKSGTVTNDVVKAIQEIKKGKIEFRVDKQGNISVGIGKISFESGKIAENIKAVYESILKAKPASLKGDYIKKLFVSSTMGPGLQLDKNF